MKLSALASNFHLFDKVADTITPTSLQGQLDQGPYPSTIRSFLDGQITGVTGEFSTLALRVKASALFEAANRLSNGWDSRKYDYLAGISKCLSLWF